VKALHRLTSFVEAAYSNHGSDLRSNGELNLIRRLSSAHFQQAMDVGANCGDWLMAALAAWPACRVHAFEVAPETFRQLSQRVHASGYAERAILNPVGVSDRSGSEPMYFFPEHPDLTCDLPRHEKYEARMFDARLLTLDEYCQTAGIQQVGFVKIDVEGAEHRVLRGFADFLTAQRVHCLQFEYGAFSTQTKYLLSDYYSLLSSKYWIGKILPTYVDFCDYEWTMDDFRFSNYCCVSKLRPDLRALLGA
jgi:FkbM family methyltransferase